MNEQEILKPVPNKFWHVYNNVGKKSKQSQAEKRRLVKRGNEQSYLHSQIVI